MKMQAEFAGAINSAVGAFLGNPLVQTALKLAAWSLVLIWLIAMFWVFRDALARSRNPIVIVGAAAMVAAATPAAFPLALLIWRILRPSQTLADRREDALTTRALEAAATTPLCQTCAAHIDAEWRRCPFCRTWLQAPCPRCEGLVEVDAAACPWCALDLAPGTLLPRPATPPPVPVLDPAAHPAPPMGVPVMAPAAVGVPVMAPSRARIPLMAAGLGEPAMAAGLADVPSRDGGRGAMGWFGGGGTAHPATAVPTDPADPDPAAPNPAGPLIAAVTRHGRDLLRRAAALAEAPDSDSDEDEGEDEGESRKDTALW